MPLTQSQCRDKVSQLIARYQKMSRDDRAWIAEAGVVHQFLAPLLEALGWPIHDPQHYKYELYEGLIPTVQGWAGDKES